MAESQDARTFQGNEWRLAQRAWMSDFRLTGLWWGNSVAGVVCFGSEKQNKKHFLLWMWNSLPPSFISFLCRSCLSSPAPVRLSSLLSDLHSGRKKNNIVTCFISSEGRSRQCLLAELRTYRTSQVARARQTDRFYSLPPCAPVSSTQASIF